MVSADCDFAGKRWGRELASHGYEGTAIHFAWSGRYLPFCRFNATQNDRYMRKVEFGTHMMIPSRARLPGISFCRAGRYISDLMIINVHETARSEGCLLIPFARPGKLELAAGSDVKNKGSDKLI